MDVVTRHRAMFSRHITNRAQTLLPQVRQATPVLPPDLLKQSLRLLDYSFRLPETWPGVCPLMLAIAPKMEQAGYRSEWIPYLKQGVHLSREIADAGSEAELLLQLGELYRWQGSYEQARTSLKASCQIFAETGRTCKQAAALNRLAHTARMTHQFQEARRLVDAALLLSGAQDAERAYSYMLLGLIASDQRQWTTAADFGSQAVTLWKEHQNMRMTARSLLVQGGALQKQRILDEAVAIFKRAVQLLEASWDPINLAVARMNLGNTYSLQQKHQKALEMHFLAERILRETGDPFYLGMLYHNIGWTYRRAGEWRKAEEAYLTSITHKRIAGAIAPLVNTMDGLGLVYLARQERVKARAVFNNALQELRLVEGEKEYAHYFETLSAHLQACDPETEEQEIGILQKSNL